MDVAAFAGSFSKPTYLLKFKKPDLRGVDFEKTKKGQKSEDREVK